MRYQVKTLLLFAFIPVIVQAGGNKGAQAINEAELRAHVEFLASPELQGRNAPGLGSEIAERYVATRWAEDGLKEFSEAPGYYQKVPLIVAKTDYAASRLSVTLERTIVLIHA